MHALQHGELALDAVDNLQLYTFVRHLHVFPFQVPSSNGDSTPVAADVGVVNDLITSAWHTTIATSFPVLTGVLRPDAATLWEQLRVHDIDASKVAERAPITFHDRRASSSSSNATHPPPPLCLNRRRVQHFADWGGDQTMAELSAPVVPSILTTMRVTLCDWDEGAGESGDGTCALVLATGVNHRVGDASSTARLLHHFASRCRALGLGDHITAGLTPAGVLGPRSQHYLQPPVFARHPDVAFPAWAGRDDPAIGDEALAGSLGLDQNDGTSSSSTSPPRAKDALVTIRFDDARLEAFRSRHADPSTATTTTTAAALPISRNDIVVAATLQLVSRGKIEAGASPDERATVLVVVDFRGSRMDGGTDGERTTTPTVVTSVPANYFGNALVLAMVDAGSLLRAAEMPLIDLVCLVHLEVRRVANDPTEINKRVQAAIRDSSFGVEMAPGLLALSSWVNGDMYATDLGWGRPYVATSVQHPLVPGLSFLGPSPPDACCGGGSGGGGGIDVPITVSAAVAEKLMGSEHEHDVARVLGVSARC